MAMGFPRNSKPPPGILPAGQLDPAVELWTEPAVLVVEHNSSIQVKLRVRCGGSDPSESGIPDIETYMQKEEVSRKPGERVLRLVKVTEWNSNSYIFHTCPNRNRTKKEIPVIVYSKIGNSWPGKLCFIGIFVLILWRFHWDFIGILQ